MQHFEEPHTLNVILILPFCLLRVTLKLAMNIN